MLRRIQRAFKSLDSEIMGDDFNVDEGEINEMKQDMKVSVICVYNKTDVFKNLLIIQYFRECSVSPKEIREG